MAISDRRVLIIYDDLLLDSSTIVTGTGWSNSVDYVSSTQLSKKAVASANTSTIALDLQRTRQLSAFALPSHTLSEDSTWRIRLSDNSTLLSLPDTVPTGEILYDSGIVDVWPDITSLTDIPYSEYSGWLSEIEDIANPPAFLYSTTTIGARYCHISFTDPNSTDFSVAKLVIGPTWRPSNGISPGWKMAYKGTRKPQRLPGGAVFTEEQKRYKQLSFSCRYLTQEEALLEAALLDRVYALKTPFVCLLDPQDLENRHRLFIYGTNSKITPFSTQQYGLFSKSLIIDEWL